MDDDGWVDEWLGGSVHYSEQHVSVHWAEVKGVFVCGTTLLTPPFITWQHVNKHCRIIVSSAFITLSLSLSPPLPLSLSPSPFLMSFRS